MSHIRAGEENTCADDQECGMGKIQASKAGESPEVALHGTTPKGFISKKGWGGARANSGGSRLNTGGARPNSGPKPKPKPAHLSIVPPVWIGHRWCVYQTYPQAERLAVENLARAGYRAYLPLTAVRRQDPVIRSMFHKILVPYMPGYSFVELHPSDPWGSMLHEPGVRSVLTDAHGRPARVPVGYVEGLRADDERRCDLSRETMTPWTVGAHVRLTEGAMASFTDPQIGGKPGVVVECDGLRTTVNVELFGRTVPIVVERAIVELV